MISFLWFFFHFSRTTTPNSLREHLKETLTKNLGGSASDIAETIEHFKNDEILDTFNIDNENVESPPVQRKAFRQRSMRLPPSSLTESNDNLSEAGSEFGNRRRNLKFRTLGSTDGHGKPLGDREIMLKKKKEQNGDQNTDPQAATTPTSPQDDMGNGLFDRFSKSRKTLTRSSIRGKKNDEDTKSLNEVSLNEKKSSITSDWRSRLASKFKKSSVDHYDVTTVENGEPSLNSYRKTSDELSVPMTEPTRRRTIDPSTHRKTSYAHPGDYDSELVDGKYVTSVPIVNPDDDVEDDGNLRPAHRAPPRGLKDLKAASNNPRDDLIARLSANKGSDNNSSSRKAVSQSNVFDRLSNPNAGGSGSSRRSVANHDTTNGSSIRAHKTSVTDDKSRSTALTKIKDLTKTLRKTSKDEDTNMIGENGGKSTHHSVAPRNSLSMFADRKPMSNLNNSKTSINSSTRSLQKDSPKTTRRATTSTLGM